AQAHRAIEAARVILRPPGLFQLRVIVDDRCIDHDAGGVQPALQRRRVDEGLEGGAGLAARLCCPVVLAELEIQAAAERDDRAVARIEGDQRALYRRRLRQRPVAVALRE